MTSDFGRGLGRCLALVGWVGVVACQSGAPGKGRGGTSVSAIAQHAPSRDVGSQEVLEHATMERSALRFLEDRGTGNPETRGPGSRADWFAAILNAAMRESRDVGPRLELAAREVVATGAGGDLCRAVAEVDHRVCCLRAGFVAAALEGLAAGLSAHPESPAACRDAETLARLEKLAREGAPEVRLPAERLLALLLAIP